MGQGIKDWSIRGLVALTLRDHGAQHALEVLQFFNLLPDIRRAPLLGSCAAPGALGAQKPPVTSCQRVRAMIEGPQPRQRREAIQD
jgi:hypothetical protein